MGKENGIVVPEFILEPQDIFCSPDGPFLNERGMGVQAILYSQHVVQEAETKNWGVEVVGMWSKRIASLQIKHKIPEEALPNLKAQFDGAVDQRYKVIESKVALGVRQRELVQV